MVDHPKLSDLGANQGRVFNYERRSKALIGLHRGVALIYHTVRMTCGADPKLSEAARRPHRPWYLIYTSCVSSI